VACAVLTVSDSRTAETDASGGLIRELLTGAGHSVCSYEILPDEPSRIRESLVGYGGNTNCQAVLVTGGTGLAVRDTTYEVVESLLDKRLQGFGELFRSLSYAEIGSAAMLSRAIGGSMDRTAVFSMPGSTPAVRLAMEKLILPELGHVVYVLTRDG
jgi:molybdenum cofactor biosynthesis protein B